MKKGMVFVLLALLIVSCTGTAPQATPGAGSQPQSNAGMANPASENCVASGGTLTIQTRGDGGQYGVCTFEDNRQCEEWALMRGECPAGGLKVTGYVTPAARYCVITGGTYAITGESNTDNEQGTCTFANGVVCDVWEYYNGKCLSTTDSTSTATASIQPLTMEVCDGEAQAMSHTLDDLNPDPIRGAPQRPGYRRQRDGVPVHDHGHRGTVRKPHGGGERAGCHAGG